MAIFNKSSRSKSATPNQLFVRGFTLIEVMIAIALLALLTAISWRGLIGMLNIQEQTKQRAQQLATFQTVLEQWTTDLENIANLPALTPIDWDGKVFRLTRTVRSVRDGETQEVQVVAWSERNIDGQHRLLRWHSAPIHSRLSWKSAWQAAQLWSQMQGASYSGAKEMVLIPIIDWHLFYARNGNWSNPLSAPKQSKAQNKSVYLNTDEFGLIPQAIRLQINVPPNNELFSGTITRDWLNPLTVQQ